MESPPEAQNDAPEPVEGPEEPVPPVTTHETTPIWAQAAPEEPPEVAETVGSADRGEAVPPLPMQKTDPDWSRTEPPAGQNASPERPWADTVPGAPGEAVAETPAPPAEPPGSPEAEAAGAEPEQAWPAEPPTETAMRAWPPPSEQPDAREPQESLGGAVANWPDSFEPAASPPRVEAPPDIPKPATFPPAGRSAQAPVRVPRIVPGWSVMPARPAPAPTPLPAATVPPPPTAATVPPPPMAATVPPVPAAPPVQSPPPIETPAPAAAAPADSDWPEAIPAIPPSAVAPQVTGTSEPVEPAPAATPAIPARPAPASQPVWAPSIQPTAEAGPSVDWPAPVEIPVWAPRIHIAPESAAGDADRPRSSQPPPMSNDAKATIPPPGSTTSSRPPGSTNPPALEVTATGSGSSAWAVVRQSGKIGPKKIVPTPEDRSYAEWFSWAKRGGAPASACHAAAQGAFRALASGKDVATAVQWATAAMGRPPAAVASGRQTYCAWFALANIDLNLDTHKAHAFATAAVRALDAGADAASAHNAGLAAAGVT